MIRRKHHDGDSQLDELKVIPLHMTVKQNIGMERNAREYCTYHTYSYGYK